MNAELRGLIDGWRAKSKSLPLVSYYGAALDTCANELEAALSVAQGQGWLPIESAPDDRQHIRGLWVTLKYSNPPRVNREWRQYIGVINDSGDFVDPEYGENYGWEPEHFDAWAELPAAPAQPDGVSK